MIWNLPNMKMLCGLDMTVRQLCVLTIVYSRQDPFTFADLKMMLGLGPAPLSRALEYLCIHELVKRERIEIDRRKVEVFRTEEGEKFVRRLTP